MLFLALFFLALVQFLNFRLSPWEMAPVPISTLSLRGIRLPLPQATCLAAGGALSGEREGQAGEGGGCGAAQNSGSLLPDLTHIWLKSLVEGLE